MIDTQFIRVQIKQARQWNTKEGKVVEPVWKDCCIKHVFVYLSKFPRAEIQELEKPKQGKCYWCLND